MLLPREPVLLAGDIPAYGSLRMWQKMIVHEILPRLLAPAARVLLPVCGECERRLMVDEVVGRDGGGAGSLFAVGAPEKTLDVC